MKNFFVVIQETPVTLCEWTEPIGRKEAILYCKKRIKDLEKSNVPHVCYKIKNIKTGRVEVIGETRLFRERKEHV